MSMPERSSPAPQTQPPSTRPSFPPGYKYAPNDKNLIETLLGREHYFGENNNSLLKFFIHQANIYESNPEQLSVEYEKGNDTEWFFISERNKKKKGKGGINQKRGDNGGYWHATVATKDVLDGQGNIIGHDTALSYYVGKQPKGVKTDWLMHEYWVDRDESDDAKPHQWQGPVDSSQPQSHDLAYQHQQFWQVPVDSSQPQYQQPHQRQPYEFTYEQYLMMTTPEKENGIATQQQQLSLPPPPHTQENGVATQHQQQQQLSVPPPRPTHGQDSRSHMVMTSRSNGYNIQEDLFDMSKDDRFFNIDELFNNEEEHSVATQQQQQQQITPSLTHDQGQDSRSDILMTDQDWSDIFNGEFFDIDGLWNDVKKGHDVCGPPNGRK
ncbi:NAC domain-containing protein 30 [Capsella rubella]|uniref:NAC domain-containing protein 30 n=1 Tax=Capsella rubella TaxID=81985 RepID=UPI000CD57708|nr:NAC domain-containing protein 30 [Capsella rubella]